MINSQKNSRRGRNFCCGDFNFLFVLRNFEESEDELREAVADSMKNLLILEDRSSEEEEDRPAHLLVQLEVQDSPSDSTVGQPGVVPSEDGDSQCSDNTQQQA